MSEIVTPQMNPFEIPEGILKYGGSIENSDSSISEELLTLILNPYYYCFPGDVGCLMIEDCLKKDPSIAFEVLDWGGRKLLNYVSMWCHDTDKCVALIRKIKEMGGDVNYSSLGIERHSPLYLAIEKGHLKKIEVLLELGANVGDHNDLTNFLDKISADNNDKNIQTHKVLQNNLKNAKKSLEDVEILYERLQKQRAELEKKIAETVEQIGKNKIKMSVLEEKIMGEKDNFDEYKKSAQDALDKKKSTILALLNKYENEKLTD